MRIGTKMSCRSFKSRPKIPQGRHSIYLLRRPSPCSSNKSMCPRMPERRPPNVVGEVRAQAIPLTKSMHLRAATPFVKSPLHQVRACHIRPPCTATARVETIIPRRPKHRPLITLAPSRARLRQPLLRLRTVRRIKVLPPMASRRVPTTMALHLRPLPSLPLSPASCTRTLRRRARPTVVRRLKKSMPTQTQTAPTVGGTATRAHSRFPLVLVK